MRKLFVLVCTLLFPFGVGAAAVASGGCDSSRGDEVKPGGRLLGVPEVRRAGHHVAEDVKAHRGLDVTGSVCKLAGRDTGRVPEAPMRSPPSAVESLLVP